MKLADVTQTFPPEINGVAITFGVIACELGRRGHAVTVDRPRRPGRLPASTPAGFTEVALPGLPVPGYPLLRFGLPAGSALRRRWRSDRPDLVPVATADPLGASAVSAARPLGLPVPSICRTNFHAYTHHYGYAPPHRLVLGWLRRVRHRTARTFAPTAQLCAELETPGFRDLALLSRGVDTWPFHPARRSGDLRLSCKAAPENPVVIHAGRMAAEKNYPLLFACFAARRAANPRCRFVLVGDGPLRPRLQRDHPECTFTGFLSRDELARHYASADIEIHASLTETFGNVLTEALARGPAVAGCDYAAARQVHPTWLQRSRRAIRLPRPAPRGRHPARDRQRAAHPPAGLRPRGGPAAVLGDRDRPFRIRSRPRHRALTLHRSRTRRRRKTPVSSFSPPGLAQATTPPPVPWPLPAMPSMAPAPPAFSAAPASSTPTCSRVSRARAARLAGGATPRVLYLINSGTRLALETATRLLAEPGWSVTGAVGRDEPLRARPERLAASRVHPATILGWTDPIPDRTRRTTPARAKPAAPPPRKPAPRAGR